MRKSNQGGFTLIESILIVVLAAVIIFAVYYFGWQTKEKAGAGALETDRRTMQTAVNAYVLNSNGLYPTEDGELPRRGEYKWILWDASFTSRARQLTFYPDFIKKLPRHWNEGIWQIDSIAKVSAAINPKDY